MTLALNLTNFMPQFYSVFLVTLLEDFRIVKSFMSLHAIVTLMLKLQVILSKQKTKHTRELKKKV